MRLPKGGRVVVVGGGPAGSFSALNLLRLSNEARLDLEVVVFEARDFNQPGPGGCNKCAGILSSTFLSSLEAFGLHLPVDIVQTELDSYILHLGETQLPIHPPDPSRRILSVYRGSGPRWGSHPLPLSFERVAITSASGYYGHRMVVVGDAAVTRLYKDGIGAAFTTAKAAIQTAIFRGISRQDFAKGYHPICRRIAIDNRFGMCLFGLWALSRRSPLLINAWKQAVLTEALLPVQDRVHERVLWSLFTGDESYSRIFSLLLSLPAFRSFLGGITKTWRRG